MATTIAINGFGRIGRLVFRRLLERNDKQLKVVAINDLADGKIAAHLLAHDSIHGPLPVPVSVASGKGGEVLSCGGQRVSLSHERSPESCAWRKKKVDIVLECTGLFTARAAAEGHLKAGAKRVLISAPASDPDITIVYGVNHKKLRKSHKLVSNASCTTNCLAPMALVLDRLAGIEHAHMTTIHAWTSDQNLHDSLHKDLRRARAAPLSMIPTSTGAAKAIGAVLPHLDGRISGCAVRVPVPNVSLVDLTARVKKSTSADKVEAAFRKAAAGNLKGILAVADAPIVSSDVNHSSFSSVFDPSETMVTNGKQVRLMGWYDNEWGFASRMADMVALMAAQP